ncbi:aminoacyl-tRNA hydrolase [Flavobacterium caeni]|uniref:Peptidyl-tRNA hydrolase n=1 Tax=Flavobacterium caeni TaxID=490189 RepID=A0A1G5EDF8_9FLAO|nr:aminoacyl-tRNA hydrolase [Flavobacterium caeni]SCY25043.1 peptidyl-tRNA hydrolase, PTH1 family [Flavobacterium caeni]
MNWFTQLFSKPEKEHLDPMKPQVHEHQKNKMKSVSNKFLIVGLGNIGAEYANTRHNIGFKVLDFLARKESLDWQTVKLGQLAEYKFKGRTFFLLKPNTYMNLSGKAVHYWMDKENIPLENVLVITDDLNLPFGTIRIKPKGSDGGHNGLKNINAVLNTQNYTRFRFGISDAFKKGQQVDYVLGQWSDEENEKLTERLDLSCDIIRSFGTAGLEHTMSGFNGK